MTEISGGVTNCLKKLSTKSSIGLAPVVIRLFGENTEIFINRAREARVLDQIIQSGFGAKVRLGLQISRLATLFLSMAEFCSLTLIVTYL